jgi:hypothetical protein
MAGTLTRPNRTAARQASDRALPLTEPQLSRAILTGTGVIVFLTLLLWLIILALIPTRRTPNVREIALGSPEGVPRPDFDPAPADKVLRSIDEFLGGHPGRPVVITVHAVGVSHPEGVDSPGAYLLAPAGSPDSPPIPVPVGDIIKILKGRKQQAPALLILDCVVHAADRRTAYFGNGFIAKLKELTETLLENDDKIAVLAACDEGQMSWTMEGQDCTVFAYFVKRFLHGSIASRDQFAVRHDLFDEVRAAVAEWVDTNRAKAVQTPILLGYEALAIKAIEPNGANGELPADDDSRYNDLLAEWEQRQRLADHVPPPYRHAPFAWRIYQDALLRAERLLRAGEASSAARVLLEARTHRRKVEDQLDPRMVAPPWSLALARKTARTTDGAGAQNPDEYERAIERSMSADRSPPPSNAGAVASGSDATKAEPAKDVAAAAGKAEAAAPRPPATTTAELLRVLASDGDLLYPKFAEGQLPVWYLGFAQRGGETAELKSDRLHLLRRAIAARKKAEQVVALDARANRLIRALVDQADELRRNAQDHLFAGDDASLKRCGDFLDQAQRSYDKAWSDAKTCAGAFDLLQKVQDTLPYYGTWIVKRGEADELLAEVMRLAAKLADVVYAAPSQVAKREDSKTQLAAAAQALQTVFQQLEDDFQNRARLIKDAGWRQIDALLQVPMIDRQTRRLLLDRARQLSPCPDSQEDEHGIRSWDKATLDKTFVAQAIGLARLEEGLSLIGGMDNTKLRYGVTLAAQDAKLSDRVFDQMTKDVRQARTEAIARAEGSEGGAGRVRDEHQMAVGDRMTRVLMAHDLAQRRGDFDPPQKLDEVEDQEFTLWNAQRLLDDFDIPAAKRLLDVLASSGARGWDESARVARERGTGSLEIAKTSNSPDATIARFSVKGRKDSSWPKGQAVMFLAHAESVRVTSPPRDKNLLAIPLGEAKTLEFTPQNEDESAVTLTPTAWFRGHSYPGDPISVPRTEWVKVEILQSVVGDFHWKPTPQGKKEKVKIKDQFLDHGHVGYFHTNKSLKYKLRVTNLSHQPLNPFVSWDGAGANGDQRLQLGPGASDETIADEATAQLSKDGKPEKTTLTVTVHDGDPRGRLLCRPLKVDFKPSDPSPYVKVTWRLLDGPMLRFKIEHLETDPVPFPVDVDLLVEPANHFRAPGWPSHEIPRGGHIWFDLVNVSPVDNFEWNLKVNSTSTRKEPGRLNDEKKKEKEKPEDAPKDQPNSNPGNA